MADRWLHHNLGQPIKAPYRLPQEDEGMSDKCKGNRLCMSRDAHETLHDQLAAKDAEIADLRRQLEISRCATSSLQQQNQQDSRRICEQAAEIAELRAYADQVDKLRAFYLRERDEARECVRRLWSIANEHADCLRAEAEAALLDRKRRGHLAELSVVEAALAATPEHLR